MNKNCICLKTAATIVSLLFLVSLMSCSSNSRSVDPIPPRVNSSSKDCNLLLIASQRLHPANRSLEPSILSGCPGPYADRIRTEAENRAFDDVLAENPSPPHIIALGVRIEAQYNRLVKKGVPPQIAIIVIEGTVSP